ncbi:unnamed protein product [Rangifer tarandus platyrhynchus]|uniref:Uncharacterized protein n=2 Tax=Rangifer tarandus platyrhynchus TaxID=3082113 RepID=A0ACB0EDN2_RANTA|nr:unnamed protein product [Rangifer tarandus platyrhynchus]CAI9698768.1 unnamed protein product [Rangifer tarandus platyrhynchus]
MHRALRSNNGIRDGDGASKGAPRASPNRTHPESRPPDMPGCLLLLRGCSSPALRVARSLPPLGSNSDAVSSRARGAQRPIGCSLAQHLSPGLGRALCERRGCPVHPRIPAAHLELTRSAPPGPRGVRSRNQETRKRTHSEVSRRRPRGLAYKLRGPVRAVTRRLRLSETARWARCTLPRGGQRGQGSARCLVLTFRLRVSLRLPSAARLTALQSRARLRRHPGPPHGVWLKARAPSGPPPSGTHGVPPALHWPQERAARSLVPGKGTVGTPPVQGPLRGPTETSTQQRPLAPGHRLPAMLNATGCLPAFPEQSKNPSASGPFWNVLYI